MIICVEDVSGQFFCQNKLLQKLSISRKKKVLIIFKRTWTLPSQCEC